MAPTVVLVNPNRIRPPIAPLAIDYLVDALDAAGLSWSVVNLCWADSDADGLRELRAACRGDVLLVAVTFRNLDDCYLATQHSFLPDLVRLVSDLRGCTEAPIVLGGTGFSVAPIEILQHTRADFGVQGDGEQSLVLLAQAILEKRDRSSVPGVVTAGGSRTPPAWGPTPDKPLSRRGIDHERYFEEGGQAGIETHRGCPGACVYCVDPHSKGPRVRARPPKTVAEEMIALADRGVTSFHTCDAELNADPVHAALVCEALIERRAADRLNWYAYCSPVPFSAELASLMRKAGCVGINFGADSGDDGQLARLGRNHRSKDIERAHRACSDERLAVMLDLLIGGPGESLASIRRTIDFVKKIGPTAAGAALGLRVYPGTKIAKTATRNDPALRGEKEGNEHLLFPLFYLSPRLGEDPAELLKSLIDDDPRFFFGWPASESAQGTTTSYNYDDNPELTQAIREGHRGAYWDILRKLRKLPLQ